MDGNISLKNDPNIKTIFISLGINLLLCITILPLVLNPVGFTLLNFLEVIYWQVNTAIFWPFTFLMLSISAFQGLLKDLIPLKELLMILIYPAGWTLLLLTIILKKGNLITLILLHILVLISFLVTWSTIFSGYDFMIG